MPITTGFTNRTRIQKAETVQKFNPNHDKHGRFAPSPGGRASEFNSKDAGPYGPYNASGQDQFGNTREAHADVEQSYTAAEAQDRIRANREAHAKTHSDEYSMDMLMRPGPLGPTPRVRRDAGMNVIPDDGRQARIDAGEFNKPKPIPNASGTPNVTAIPNASGTPKITMMREESSSFGKSQAEQAAAAPVSDGTAPQRTTAPPAGIASRASLTSSTPDFSKHSINELARMAQRDWSQKGKGVNFAAKPYLSAMRGMEKASDMYGADTGESVIGYFLSNAASWRGPVAKQVKDELKRRLKRK